MSWEGSSGGYSEINPVDWCALLRREGPLGLLGAPIPARLCGIDSWPEGPPVTLEWEGSSLPIAGGGPPALLGSPPRRSVEPPPRRPLQGKGNYSANPLLHRRQAPGASRLTFPGCTAHPWEDGVYVGLPTLEPLWAARPPEACGAATWRPGSPPRVGGHGILDAGDCLEAVQSGRRIRVCGLPGGYMVEVDGHASVYASRIRLERECGDYMIALTHPGGPVWFYGQEYWEGSSPGIAVECPRARLYAASPGWVKLRVQESEIRLEAGGDGPIVVGLGGAMRAALAAVESVVDPGYRWPRPGVGHARCGGCTGLASIQGSSLRFTLWAPVEPGVFEARIRVVLKGRARVVDALGESWVPVEAGLFRVPLPRGWHSMVEVEVEEWGRPEGARLVSLLKRRLAGRAGD